MLCCKNVQVHDDTFDHLDLRDSGGLVSYELKLYALCLDQQLLLFFFCILDYVFLKKSLTSCMMIHDDTFDR